MDTLALILSIIGAVNWGLVGICQFDLVAWLFGGQTGVVSRIIYTLVGLAGLWCVSLLFRRSLPRPFPYFTQKQCKIHKWGLLQRNWPRPSPTGFCP